MGDLFTETEATISPVAPKQQGRAQVLAFVTDNEPVTALDVEHATWLPRSVVRERIAELVADGLIEECHGFGIYRLVKQG